MIAAITKGIQYCHQNDIIHHDLKLENILVKINEKARIKRVKLADFGISRKVSERLQAGPDTRGTL